MRRKIKKFRRIKVSEKYLSISSLSKVAILEPGEIFGDEEVLLKIPRKYTAITSMDTTIIFKIHQSQIPVENFKILM